MTISQWLCEKIRGHKFAAVRQKVTFIEHDRMNPELSIVRDGVIEFDVCKRCGFESKEFMEVNHE